MTSRFRRVAYILLLGAAIASPQFKRTELNDKERLIMFELNEQAQKAFTAVQEAQQKFQQTQMNFGAELAKLRASHSAEGCSLSQIMQWEKCTPPVAAPPAAKK